LGMVLRDREKSRTYQVIGLVGDSKYYELREEPVPIVYVSFSQENGPEEHSTLMIRSGEPLLPLTSSITRAARDINPAMVLTFSVLKTQIREGLLRERLMATLSGFFGVLATILAMVGLYGIVSFMVSRRRNEIGVRMALGANRNNILLMVLREAAMLLAMGLVIGTGLALAAGTVAASMLYGLKPQDPLTLGAAIAGMAGVALVASLLPAHRAATVNPMEALREE
jgi:putative ABC transport system permease protein